MLYKNNRQCFSEFLKNILKKTLHFYIKMNERINKIICLFVLWLVKFAIKIIVADMTLKTK